MWTGGRFGSRVLALRSRGGGLMSSRRQETGGSDRLTDAADAQAVGLPTGTVTFVFTDIEGSTRLLEELGGEPYGAELEHHRERVRRVVTAHDGVELGTEGDAFFLAFARASDALAAASDVQSALADGHIRMRIGIHTGEPLIVAGNYVGLDVHRAARICDAAHGGQVLVSQATRDLAGDGLRDLGDYRLKDVTAPERLFQLGGDEFPPLRTLRPTNLPIQPGPLLGRRDELTDLLRLAAGNRLVTLTGPGGSGKTRLALALAGELSDEYRDGAWWVPLAPVTDAELVPATIAQSLGARGELEEHLAGKQALVLLDNLEQVLDCAPVMAELLARLPELSVIATSRERLAISFEQEYPVSPLDEATAEELFVSRARQIEPDFEPDETVGEICERLDRLPLALELASTRVKLMSTAQMLDRIERRLDLLSKGRRDAPDRQATMRATIGWSYDLLPENEQALFRGLGVFAGSFELEAAEAVCDANLDDLQSLVEKSLLRRDGHGRFFLLELTREYALEQLSAAGEEMLLRQSHAEWFLQLGKRADEYEQGAWFARLEADTDNLRAVLAWCAEQNPAAAIELAPTLRGWWRMHGRQQELISWLEEALATSAAVDVRTRAVGLRTLGDALIFSEQQERARVALEESLTVFRQLGDKSGEALVLTLLGSSFDNLRSCGRAIEFAKAALTIARETGDKPTVAHALNILGCSLLTAGELEPSRAAFEEAAAIQTELGDRRAAADDLDGLAVVALMQRDPERAAARLREVLNMNRDLDNEDSEICPSRLRLRRHPPRRRP